MNFFENILNNSSYFMNILSELYKKNKTICINGLSDIHKAHFIHTISKKTKRTALLIAQNESSAQKIAEDLNAMGSSVCIYPFRDFNFNNISGQSKEYEHKRLFALSNILDKNIDVVITCIDAALQYTIPKSLLLNITFSLKVSQSIPIEKINYNFLNCGYERFDQVEGAGQFSIRGGIVDFFPPHSKRPIRLEFWGDEIDSISYFDISTQRREEQIDEITITPACEIIVPNKKNLANDINKIINKLESQKYNQKAINILKEELNQLETTGHLGSYDKFISLIYEKNTLFDYFDSDTIFFVSEEAKVADRLNSMSFQWNEDLTSYLEDGILSPCTNTFFEDKVYLLNVFSKHNTVYMDTFLGHDYFTTVHKHFSINARQLPTWNGSISLLQEDLLSISDISTLVILAGTNRSALSLSEDLKKKNFNLQFVETLENTTDGSKYITTGSLSAGFEYPDINFSLITHSHANINQKTTKRKIKGAKSIYSISDLNIGDYVVHSLHGIGIFNGIHSIEIQNIKKDYIKISYAKGDILYVPVTQLDMVDKYIGPGADSRIKLNKLGSNDWQKSKAKVKKATKDIAKELIKLYSERMKTQGFAFSEDNELQRDFESHFEYEETIDQLKCIDEIKHDMQRDIPMDRLLCGDVGFGKTEVALRAAFKCVSNSKQCAILVPTTILAWQHFQNILKRFESFPIRIELLSRFRTPKQQSDILKRLKRGEIDIIVGTHRLVQKDVSFYDLGLVIIDEEQRFGVAQKENFKNIVKNVDVLTLSATPIPRTLNMAMSGIRDMSSIEEAPQNRYPVQTYVLEHDQVIINEAIRRELRRGGQVYYMHNNVGTISQTAAKIQAFIPEAKVGYAHGKMSEKELSYVWAKVISQEIDVLVCTTIIETGVDIPNVNTLIIEDADHLGLSQLHQIRGRVGRSSRRAFAYFTYKPSKILSDISQKRLAAIREFTEFGSGFKIAMRDLELRGAGNILGGDQHGHMADVGYDMYLRMLGESVKEEKGEIISRYELDCLIDVQINANIPENYIKNVNQRLDIYRRVSSIRSDADATDVIDELIDRFGEPPPSVKALIDIALVRTNAASLGINELRQQNDKILLFSKNIDHILLQKLIDKKDKRISIKSGKSPHISINIDSKKSLIENLNDILSINHQT